LFLYKNDVDLSCNFCNVLLVIFLFDLGLIFFLMIDMIRL